LPFEVFGFGLVLGGGAGGFFFGAELDFASAASVAGSPPPSIADEAKNPPDSSLATRFLSTGVVTICRENEKHDMALRVTPDTLYIVWRH